MTRLLQYAFAIPQYLLPHHLLSRLMRRLTHAKCPHFRKLFIQWFIKTYQVNLQEAQREQIEQYECFNDFFTRELKAEARPLAASNCLASPADGCISQFGTIEQDRLIQAKGRDYTLSQLLAGHEELSRQFSGGEFATIYLSPKDYHRLHMPVAGTLREMIYVPGRLFSVNNATTQVVPNLFARNERVIAVFDTDYGPMALILVGAIFVASIETVWHGEVTPPNHSTVQSWRYSGETPPIKLDQGEEMGRFNMGSTIIMLFGANQINWLESVLPGQSVRMGEAVARRSAG